MHSPQWLRIYLAHLGLLLPALDALWCTYPLPSCLQVHWEIQCREPTPRVQVTCDKTHICVRVDARLWRLFANTKVWSTGTDHWVDAQTGGAAAQWTSSLLSALALHQ